MARYPESAVERAMKVQEVLLRAMGGQLSWVQAGEILGLCPRQVRRLRQRLEDDGYAGLFDRRRAPSPKRVPVAMVTEVLTLYREHYADCNVQHFHELLAERHQITLSYSWVKRALQTAGLVPVRRRRGAHRRRRERRPLPGLLLHIDASRHAWVPGAGLQDLVSISDDATQ
jgi:transposase